MGSVQIKHENQVWFSQIRLICLKLEIKSRCTSNPSLRTHNINVGRMLFHVSYLVLSQYKRQLGKLLRERNSVHKLMVFGNWEDISVSQDTSFYSKKA